MNNYYQEEFTLHAADTDVKGIIKPTYILNLMQETAISDAARYQILRDRMINNGVILVLVKIFLNFEKPINYKDKFEVTTWLTPFNRFFGNRYHQFKINNQIIGVAKSTWAVIDFNKKTLASANRLGSEIPNDFIYKESLPVIEVPDFEFNGYQSKIIEVPNTFIDLNGHVNNNNYIDWALNLLDYNYYKTHYIKELSLSFIKEVLPNQTIEIRYQQNGDYFKTIGVQNGQTLFNILIKFQEL